MTATTEREAVRLRPRGAYRGSAEGGGLRLAIPADGPVARALDLTGVGRYIPTFSSVEGPMKPCQREVASSDAF